MKFTRVKCLFVSFLLFSTAHVAQFSQAHGKASPGIGLPYAGATSLSVGESLTPPWIRYPSALAEQNTSNEGAKVNSEAARTTGFPWLSTGFMITLIIVIALLKEKAKHYKRSATSLTDQARKTDDE